MRASTCVGRAGGLAVALGIGVVVTIGGPVAAAAPSDSTAAADQDSNSSSAAASRSSVRSRSGRSSAASRGSALSRNGGAAVTAPQAQENNSTSTMKVTRSLSAMPRPALVAFAETAGARIGLESVVAQPITDGASSAQGVVLASPTAVAAAQPAAGGKLDSVLFNPFGATPGVPTKSPMAWLTLAVARRQTASKTGRATASVTSTNPIAAMFFNQTPTISWTSSPGQSGTGVVAGSFTALDGEGDPLAYTVNGAPAHGTVALSTDGSYSYTPSSALAFDGTTDSFSVSVSDAGAGFHIHGIGGLLNLLTFGLLGSSGHSSTVTVPVTIAAWRHQAPTATVNVGLPEATAGVVVGTVVGTSSSGSPLTYSAPASTAKGSVSVNASTGAFTYTPTALARQNAGLTGATAADKADSFTVTVTDGYGGSVAVPVNVAVSPTFQPNHAPVAGAVTVGTPNASTGVVTGSVTATDADNDPLTYGGSTTTSKGSVTVTTGGSFTYTPTLTARHGAARNGATASDTTDSFTVTVSDGRGGTAAIAVTVTVAPSNVSPVGGTPNVGTPDASTGVVTGTVSATDANGDSLTYSGSATTSHGSVTVAANGSFTYTPTATARHAAAMIGASASATTDTFTVAVSDGYGGTTAVPVVVAIGPANANPVAGNASVGTPNAMTGVLTGTVNATDPEGDTLTYSTSANPTKGTVTVNVSSGTFSYTPTPSARGVVAGSDSFTVTVTDGYGGSTAVVVSVPVAATPVANAMITYVFNYGSGAQYWTPDAMNALEIAANRIASYIVVAQPVTITIDVTAANNPSSATLASAGSDLISGQAGFYSTVVQNKILTGVDANGAAGDAAIDVNFGIPFAFGDTIGVSQYDFQSTMMHEMMHAYGFLSYVDEAGWNTGTSWTTFDTFIVNAAGTAVINPNTRLFNVAYNANLTGANGGLYFGGANAQAAYGGPVPLYAPNPWEMGSSISHLDDYTFWGANAKLMNAITDTGLGIRTLSLVEQGILKDLGYTV